MACRPSYLFGAVILLLPLFHTVRQSKRAIVPLFAAIGPIALVGIGLMIYNYRRFENPFEVGLHYQLAGAKLVSRQFLSPHNLWFNFCLYFLEHGPMEQPIPVRASDCDAACPAEPLGSRNPVWRFDEHARGVAGAGRAAGVARRASSNRIGIPLVSWRGASGIWDHRRDGLPLFLLGLSI